jgi:hypothetical protein
VEILRVSIRVILDYHEEETEMGWLCRVFMRICFKLLTTPKSLLLTIGLGAGTKSRRRQKGCWSTRR